jgi:ketosteroid isomerase-like protein
MTTTAEDQAIRTASEGFFARYGRAWADHDLDAILAMHTEDSVFHLHDVAEPLCGRAAVRGAIASAFEQISDLEFERERVLFGSDHVVSEYVMRGAVGDKPFACDGVDVFTLRNGLIARKDSYVDWLTYARQVGLDTIEGQLRRLADLSEAGRPGHIATA